MRLTQPCALPPSCQRMLRKCFAILFVIIISTLIITPTTLSFAQETDKKIIVIDKKKLIGNQRNADGTVEVTPFTEDPVMWVRTQQQNIYGRISKSIRELKSSSSATAAWTLLTISFLYGVFHAAGPGHGKAVVTGWVLATENQLRRGILIAFLSALIQAMTAIVVVSALLLLVSGAAAMARNVAEFLESASYLMIAGMGLYLIWNGWGKARPKPVSLSAAAVPGPFELVSRPDSGHDHVHDENCGCGHAHMPAASAVAKDMSLRDTFAMAFAVGIRPCSGAILVLVASYTLGIYWAGVLSTLAMGIGVFLTISFIAVLAVYAKSLAFRLTGADNPMTRLVVRWGKIMTGAFIAGFGVLLFMGSLGTSSMVI
jgi:nickel/cobalt transporter (NicO) family protein